MSKEELKENQIEITFFTDPLCCWSWGMYTPLRQLLQQYGSSISLELCMGGMIHDRDTFNDELLSVHNPAQMGPLWMQASENLEVPLNFMIWTEDPPSSSYPACLAVAAARLQSKEASEKMYLTLSMKSEIPSIGSYLTKTT